MKKYIGCDAHARYSIFASVGEDGRWDTPVRVEHNELEMERYLKQLPAGTLVALESSGNWYWLVRRWKRQGWIHGWRTRWKQRNACRDGTRPITRVNGPEPDVAVRRGSGDPPHKMSKLQFSAGVPRLDLGCPIQGKRTVHHEAGRGRHAQRAPRSGDLLHSTRQLRGYRDRLSSACSSSSEISMAGRPADRSCWFSPAKADFLKAAQSARRAFSVREA